MYLFIYFGATLTKNLFQATQMRPCVVWKLSRLSTTRLAQFFLFFAFGLVNWKATTDVSTTNIHVLPRNGILFIWWFPQMRMAFHKEERVHQASGKLISFSRWAPVKICYFPIKIASFLKFWFYKCLWQTDVPPEKTVSCFLNLSVPFFYTFCIFQMPHLAQVALSSAAGSHPLIA